MNDTIVSDRLLSPAAEATLRALAGTIIPASAEHGIPGADDADIFADVLASAGNGLGFLDEAMRMLDAEAGPPGFCSAAPDRQLALAEQFRASQPAAAGLVITLVCQCYYRDPRVLTSLGMSPRAPFPEGYRTPDGDWRLLDPVRARAPFYRRV